ncbi:MAG: EAL domain-containing protein [Pyrinomonadaceae bacterium]
MWTKQLGFIKGFTATHDEMDESVFQNENPSQSAPKPKRVNRKSNINDDLLLNAFEYAPVCTMLVTSSGEFIKANRSFYNTFGYWESDLPDLQFQSLIQISDLELVYEKISQLLTGDEKVCWMEMRFRHKQGHFLWTTWAASSSNSGLTGLNHLIFQLQAVSHRKRAEQRIIPSAMHDQLTGLPNRILLMERLAIAFKLATKQPNKQFAVLYLNYERFESLNDDIELEHQLNEELSVKISQRLESALRSGDTVARLNGDEFAVLLENFENDEEIPQIIERLQKKLLRPLQLNQHEVFINLCIGAALWTPDYERPELLLRDANTAFYQAKRTGRGHFEVFNSETHKRASYLQQLENDLKLALERDEFCLYYQPIINLENCRLAGLEALIRWQHPKLGQISPMEFIGIAEETGLISSIGMWVIRESCRQLSAWHELHKNSAKVWLSVNVSGKQLLESNFSEQVDQVLRETKNSPSSLKLEITESAVIKNMDSAVDILKQLNELGVQLSVDDFGTGYSSLNNVHRLPVHSLKIDRSFLANTEESEENWEIIKTVMSLAQSLDLEVIAEGVETSTQVVRLLTLGCKLGQGYYFAQPLEVAAIDNLFSELQYDYNQEHKTIDEQMIDSFGNSSK